MVLEFEQNKNKNLIAQQQMALAQKDDKIANLERLIQNLTNRADTIIEQNHEHKQQINEVMQQNNEHKQQLRGVRRQVISTNIRLRSMHTDIRTICQNERAIKPGSPQKLTLYIIYRLFDNEEEMEAYMSSDGTFGNDNCMYAYLSVQQRSQRKGEARLFRKYTSAIEIKRVQIPHAISFGDKIKEKLKRTNQFRKHSNEIHTFGTPLSQNQLLNLIDNLVNNIHHIINHHQY